ncbi:MAG: hypothetical protein IPG74_03080 [Flavobacteriales bacterium]|nr:hypothetical protein [Flavobacteriales bacterium]
MAELSPVGAAVIVHPAPDISVVQFNPDVKLTAEVLRDVLHERGGCEAPGVMLVMPEYIDFDTKLLQADHHTMNALAHHTAAVAILCHGQEIADWFKLYFAYYPPAFAVAYFSAYPKAYAWLVANTPKGPES